MMLFDSGGAAESAEPADRPVLLVNWTALSDGQIGAPGTGDEAERHALMTRLIARLLEDFDSRSEDLFERRMGFHATTETVGCP